MRNRACVITFESGRRVCGRLASAPSGAARKRPARVAKAVQTSLPPELDALFREIVRGRVPLARIANTVNGIHVDKYVGDRYVGSSSIEKIGGEYRVRVTGPRGDRISDGTGPSFENARLVFLLNTL